MASWTNSTTQKNAVGYFVSNDITTIQTCSYDVLWENFLESKHLEDWDGNIKMYVVDVGYRDGKGFNWLKIMSSDGASSVESSGLTTKRNESVQLYY